MNIILLQASDFTAPDKVCLQGRVVTHINKVLKVGVGQPLKVGLINGPRGVGVVTNLDSKSVELEVALDQPPPEEPKISLLIALPRPQTLKKLLLEVVSLGVKELCFVRAEKTEKSYFQSKMLKDEKYLEHALLGLEQSGDTRMPVIRFEGWLGQTLKANPERFSGHRLLYGHPGGKALTELERGDRPTWIAIGPEGGWVQKEQHSLSVHGFEKIDLGPRILRVETAAIVSVAQVAILNSMGAAS